MRKVIILPSFERTAKKLSLSGKKQLAKSLQQFNTFLITGSLPIGLGFKKINHDKYEFRVGLRLRVIVKVEADIYYLVLVGSHQDIKRYLNKFR